jgi:hypothetical protein
VIENNTKNTIKTLKGRSKVLQIKLLYMELEEDIEIERRS